MIIYMLYINIILKYDSSPAFLFLLFNTRAVYSIIFFLPFNVLSEGIESVTILCLIRGNWILGLFDILDIVWPTGTSISSTHKFPRSSFRYLQRTIFIPSHSNSRATSLFRARPLLHLLRMMYTRIAKQSVRYHLQKDR